MDFNSINLLWAILVLPITWLYNAWTLKTKEIAALKDGVSSLEKEVSSLKEKIDPLSEDIKQLTKAISQAELEMEKRLLNMTIESMKKRGDFSG